MQVSPVLAAMNDYTDQFQAIVSHAVAKCTMAGLRVLDTPGILDEGWVPFSGYFWAHNHGNDMVHRCLILNNTIKVSYRTPSDDIQCIVPTIFPADSRCNFLQEDGQFAGVVASPMRVPSGVENRAIRSLIRNCIIAYGIQWADELTRLLCVEETSEQPITIAALQKCIDIASLPDRLDIIDEYTTAEPEILQIVHQLQLLTDTALQDVSSALNTDKMTEIATQCTTALQRRSRWTKDMLTACTIALIHYIQHIWYKYRRRVVFMLLLSLLSVVALRWWLLQHADNSVAPLPSNICDGLPWITTNYTCTDAYCVLDYQWQSLQAELAGHRIDYNNMSPYDQHVYTEVDGCLAPLSATESLSTVQRLRICDSEFVQQQQAELLRSNQTAIVVTTWAQNIELCAQIKHNREAYMNLQWAKQVNRKCWEVFQIEVLLVIGGACVLSLVYVWCTEPCIVSVYRINLVNNIRRGVHIKILADSLRTDKDRLIRARGLLHQAVQHASLSADGINTDVIRVQAVGDSLLHCIDQHIRAVDEWIVSLREAIGEAGTVHNARLSSSEQGIELQPLLHSGGDENV